ncbi:hypothetical protein Tsp_10613 [Trichinella spiralis]|uniref:hypothetical protein n=1 Tax=Trichinella spiralis TaxID=6334 RepID=UPI0001EFD9C6|nr:hypothetical protein Tsp_10613 [Trichinella spiralis]
MIVVMDVLKREQIWIRLIPKMFVIGGHRKLFGEQKERERDKPTNIQQESLDNIIGKGKEWSICSERSAQLRSLSEQCCIIILFVRHFTVALYNYSALLFGSINALYHTLANAVDGAGGRNLFDHLTANDNVDDEVALRNEMLPSIQ